MGAPWETGIEKDHVKFTLKKGPIQDIRYTDI